MHLKIGLQPPTFHEKSTTLFLELVVLFAGIDGCPKGGSHMIKQIEIGKAVMRKDCKGRAICILVW